LAKSWIYSTFEILNKPLCSLEILTASLATKEVVAAGLKLILKLPEKTMLGLEPLDDISIH
jgi:hypothetical protein